MPALVIVTSLATLLVTGFIAFFLARKTKLHEGLLLLVLGIIIGKITLSGVPIVALAPETIAGIATIALALIAFDTCARTQLHELDTPTRRLLKTALYSAAVIFAALILAGYSALGLTLFTSAILAAVILGIGRGNEGKLLTPLSIIIPFIILDFVKTTGLQAITSIVIGIGTGAFIGLALFKLIHYLWNKPFAPLAVFIAILLSWTVAGRLGGNSVLSVCVLGLFLAHAYSQHKITLLHAEHALAKIISALVFLLLGIIIPLDSYSLLAGGLLFIAYALVRFMTLLATHKRPTLETLSLALNASQGLASAAVVLLLFSVFGLVTLSSIAIACILCTLVVS